MTYSIDFDEIVNYFNDYNKEINIDNYYDIKHDAIEEYLLNNDYENKELVDKFGVFKALKLYTDTFGEFCFKRTESEMYATLAYIIISDKFDEKYSDYTDMLNAIDDLDRCITDEPYRCDGGCGKIMGDGKDHDCVRVCNNCEDECEHSDDDDVCDKFNLTNNLSTLDIQCN